MLSLFQKIEKVILFGSRAKGNYKNGSDIDLAVIGKEMQHDDLLLIQSKLEALHLPWRFDVLLFEKINDPHVTGHIHRVGIEFYKNEKTVS